MSDSSGTLKKSYGALALGAGLSVLFVGAVFFLWYRSHGNDAGSVPVKNELRILAYSSFTASWGPGPTLARMFEHQMIGSAPAGEPPIKVVMLQAEDAGLLLSKMDVFPADVVVGFDQLSLEIAAKKKTWRPHGVTHEKKYSTPEFLAFDWAPLGFVYRDGEVDPPKSLDDLLSPRFRGTISLQDPRSSSPGFQFLSWLIEQKGADDAFRFLKELKPNVHSVAGSWSQSYGVFSRGLARLTFSYATSTLYHRFTEKDERYRFAAFNSPHPVQVEYAAISKDCRNCELAEKFMKFLSDPPAQSVLMNKNWMLPTNPLASRGTPFESLQDSIGPAGLIKIISPMMTEKRTVTPETRDGFLRRWTEVGF